MHTINILSDLYYYRPQGKLVRLLLSGVVRRISFTLIWLFSPVYIYLSLIDLDYTQKVSILFIILFYLLSNYITYYRVGCGVRWCD